MSFYGPFKPHYRAQAFGYEIPNIEAFPEGENMCVVLDRRFGLTASVEECERWLPLLANAMAIGAGYSCHGENSVPINKFKVKVMKLGNEEIE